jgi:hypothetical protein
MFGFAALATPLAVAACLFVLQLKKTAMFSAVLILSEFS